MSYDIYYMYENAMIGGEDLLAKMIELYDRWEKNTRIVNCKQNEVTICLEGYGFNNISEYNEALKVANDELNHNCEGLDPEERIKDFLEVLKQISDDKCDGWDEFIARVLRNGDIAEFSNRYRRKTGSDTMFCLYNELVECVAEKAPSEYGLLKLNPLS